MREDQWFLRAQASKATAIQLGAVPLRPAMLDVVAERVDGQRMRHEDATLPTAFGDRGAKRDLATQLAGWHQHFDDKHPRNLGDAHRARHAEQQHKRITLWVATRGRGHSQ